MRSFALLMGALIAAGVAVAARADDPEPPAGPAAFRKLQGKWAAARLTSGGRSTDAPSLGLTYTFERDKLVIDSGKSPARSLTVKLVRKSPPFALECSVEGGPSRPILFKLVKGELHLVTRGVPRDLDALTDFFSGNDVPVIVFTRPKK